VAKPNSWDWPPPEPKGDANEMVLHHAVGVACTRFEVLQTHLVWLFGALVCSDSWALRRAFGTLENVPPKVQMIKAAASISLQGHTELLPRVKNVLTEVENFNLRRNDIVHAQVTSLNLQGVEVGYYLIPGDHVTKKMPIPPNNGEWWNYRLTAKQINAMALEFRRVSDAVESLTADIKAFFLPITQPRASPDTSGKE
jgi:hypothetical protein